MTYKYVVKYRLKETGEVIQGEIEGKSRQEALAGARAIAKAPGSRPAEVVEVSKIVTSGQEIEQEGDPFEGVI